MSGVLAGKRVLVLGAETEVGRAVVTAVAEAGASVAAVAATSEAEAAFAVQRLARRLSSGERKVIAQAIDATNEAAVRVMVRQVSKELGGLNAVVHSLDQVNGVEDLRNALATYSLLLRYVGKELDRVGGGGQTVLVFSSGPRMGLDLATGAGVFVDQGSTPKWRSTVILGESKPPTDVAVEVVRAIAGEADSG